MILSIQEPYRKDEENRCHYLGTKECWSLEDVQADEMKRLIASGADPEEVEALEREQMGDESDGEGSEDEDASEDGEEEGDNPLAQYQ